MNCWIEIKAVSIANGLRYCYSEDSELQHKVIIDFYLK